MKVLVTGAAGFLGRYVAQELAEAGHQMVPYDLPRHDVCDRTRAASMVAECDHVIHLAWVLGTAELFDSPHHAVEVNVVGTLNMLQACAKSGAGYTGITMPRVWDNVYQATKGCAQALAAAWNRHEGVRVSHVRAFNAYGPGQKLGPVQKIIPTFSYLAWQNHPLPIWGSGEQKADLVFAGDIARMLVAATEFGDNEVFDAGTGIGYSVLGIAEQIIARTGSQAGVEMLPMRKGEHPADVVAKGEGWDLLDWKPREHPERLAQTVDSYRELARHAEKVLPRH